MRGKRYDPGSRRVFSGGGYIGVIVAIIVLAALIAITLLVALPTTEEIKQDAPTIVSIRYDYSDIGMGSDPGDVLLTVTYSDSSTTQVALSGMSHSGLDVTKEGKQNVSLSYGGFEDTIPITVRRIDCVRSYTASDGGRIEGEAVQYVVSGQDADTVIAIPETGYTFVEWSDGYPYAKRKDLAVNESKEIMAKFEKTKFTVTFHFMDGTTNKEEKVVYGEKAVDVPDHNDPRMRVYGYTFVGWSVSEEDYSHVLRDMDIYPRYEKTATDVTVEVSRDRNGNVMGKTDANESGYYAHSETERAVITASPDNSRSFKSWQVLNSDGKYVDLGRDSTEEREVEIGDNRTKVSFRVSAGTEPGKYVISFLCNAQMDYVALKAVFAYDNSSLRFVNYQNKNTDNIECWVDDVAYTQTIGEKIAESGVERADGKETVIDSDVLSPSYGLVIPADVAGMTFVGWYLQGDPEQTTVSRELMLNEPSVLIAKWEKKVYTLVFEYVDEHGDKNVYSDDVKVYYQNTVGSGGGIPAGVPTRDRYVFNGWEDAYTHTMVDDSTQIIMQDEYGTDIDSDFAQGIIRLIAKWEPVRHDLTVYIEGEGHVVLTDMEGTKQDVLGITPIYESYTYTATFSASNGYKVEYVDWEYSSPSMEGGEYYNGEEASATSFEINLKERANNVIAVKFVPRSYRVTVRNGEEGNTGYVTVDGVMRNELVISDLYVNMGEAISLNIKSFDSAYSIEKVFLSGSANGRTYENTVVVDYEGMEENVTEYDLALTRCSSDITVAVRYRGRSFAVSTNNTYDAETGTYYLKRTTLNGRSSDYVVPDAQENYNYGTELFYVVEAPEGEYVSSFVLNGIPYDAYSRTGSVVCYGWYVNDVYLGIDLKKINDEYYYCYGKAGESEFGVDYIYCERVSDGKVTVFVVENEETGEYSEYVTASNAAGDNTSVSEYLVKQLDVENRSIFDTSKEKDLRVTSFKIMLIPERNVNVSLTFEEITYDVFLSTTDYGVETASAETVVPGESVYFSATPVTGYVITGYVVNDMRTEVSDISFKNGLEFTVNDIREDLYVEILYEIVTYNVVFTNVTVLEGDVYAEREIALGENDKRKLASGAAFAVEYSATAKFEVTVENGKRIVSVKINGEEQPLPFNATEFDYTLYNADKSVQVDVECGDLLPNENTGDYIVAFGSDANVSSSVQYGDGENVLWFVMKDGSDYKNITISGIKDNESKVVSISFDEPLPSFVTVSDDGKTVRVTLPSDAFDDATMASCSTARDQYTVSVVNGTEEGGTITGGGNALFGNIAPITVSAFDDYYVSSFKVNGKEISFASANWTERNATRYDGKYKGGVYELTVDKDMTVEVTFSLFTYKVSLDKNSINGTTSFFFDGNDGTNRIEHGKDLIVSMSADPGYHIARILVNGIEMTDYVPYTNVANDNTVHSYTYTGVDSDVSVYVVYAINRYNFKYELINGSENFIAEANTGNKLECPDATADGANAFTDIAHGENFSFVVTPGVGKGYYIYSITIKYVGYEGGSRTRYYTDGFFDANGATVWFNNFLWDNNIAGSVGVTSNIELISVTFRKRTFNVSATTDGDEGGGSIALNVTNSVNQNANGGIVLFHVEEGAEDRYQSTEKFMLVGQYVYAETSAGVYSNTPSDITFRNLGGVWGFYTSDGTYYDMYFEYGLRIALTIAPAEGFDRTSFVFNGEERNDNVFSNRYSFNIYRDTTVNVTYLTQTFTITLEATAYTASMSVVGKQNVYSYVSFGLYEITTSGRELVAEIGEGSASVSVVLDYGTRYVLIVTPNFAKYGAYLYNLQVNGTSSPYHDTGSVVYGGTGIRAISEMNYKITTRIMEYTVTAAAAYDEDITEDAKNQVFGDETNAKSWTTTWNGSAAVRIIADQGYFVNRVKIQNVENGTYVTIADYQDIDGAYGGEELGYGVVIGDEDPIKGVRDVVTVYGVKNDYLITAYFIRREFSVIYEINNPLALDEIITSINSDGVNFYPERSTSTKTSGSLTVLTRYYDDLVGLIKPMDGYEIRDAKLTVTCMEYDEETEDYVPKKDNNGRDITFELALTKASGEEKSFTFHPADGSQRFVDSVLKISVSINIKEYRVYTTVSRSSAANDRSTTKNETEVRTTVLTQYNEYVQVAGEMQGVATFRPGVREATLTAEHHGTVEYAFIASAGYMLYNFRVNGFTLEELQQTNNGVLKSFTMTKTPTRASDGTEYNGYSYSIALNVTTALINGSGAFVSDSSLRVTFEIAPVIYDIKIVLNGQIKDFQTLNGKNGVIDDNNQIIVYAPESVRQFGTFNVEPSLFEGYEITDTTTFIYFGTSAAFDPSRATGFMAEDTVVSSNKTFTASTDRTTNADASLGVTTIYFIYNTNIISYQHQVTASVFYSQDGELKTVPLAQNPAAGSVSVSVVKDGYGIQEFAKNLHESGQSFNFELEYFSVIQIEAQEGTSFKIYGIYEIFPDGTERKIVSGQRSVTYMTSDGRYVVSIAVRNATARNAATGAVETLVMGNRSFRIDFKQESSVSLTVANPYKYISANGRYYSYLTVTAYTSENEMTDGVPTSDLTLGLNVPVTTAVIEKYTYTVYVGNYLKFVLYDTYSKTYVTTKIYASDLREDNGTVQRDSVTAIEPTGTGERVHTPSADYYAYVDVGARISVTRTNTGAISTTSPGTITMKVGDRSVTSDASVFTTVSTATMQTTPTNTMSVTVAPNDNYVFYRLKVLQINKARTLTQGYVTFQTADALRWNEITKDTLSDQANIDNFNENATSGIKLMSVETGENGAYTFNFWICGDAEITVDFYRTYQITYGVYLADKIKQEGKANGLITSGVTVTSVRDPMFGTSGILVDENNYLLSTTATVSYGTQFIVKTEKPDGDYQFVGWYANGYDLYSYLRTLLPTDEYMEETIVITVEEMQSLVQNGTEVTEIELYAVFEPIIDVMVYNEKYYAYENHFNSWNLLTVLASYYPFERGRPINSATTETSVRDTTGQDIVSAKSNLGHAKVNDFTTAWSSLLAETDVVKDYSGDMLANKVYSSYKEFSILSQNITNADYYTMSWEDTLLTLTIANRADSAVFSSWQYFNWNTMKWMNIPYQRKGSGATANTYIDCYFANYVIDIPDALYAIHDGSVDERDVEKVYYNNVAMPYAVSASNEKNVATSADDVRPLLIRPDFYQSVSINLSQNLYRTDLGDEDPEQSVMPNSLVSPAIDVSKTVDQSVGMNRSVTPSPFMKGTFEYGTSITVTNNKANPGGEVLNGNARYRFLGWFMKYNNVFYYLPNSESDASGSPYFTIKLTCKSDYSETNMLFSAVYVLQYKQTVYSYNISGSGTTNANNTDYASTSLSTNSFAASPVLTVTTNLTDNGSATPDAIVFNTLPMNSTYIDFTHPTTTNKYYWVTNANVNSSTNTRTRANADATHFTVSGRSLDYYYDVGCTFNIKMPDNYTSGETTLEEVKTSAKTGYCPETDTMYKYIKNKTAFGDYSGYYNTGHGTYFDVETSKTVAASDLTRNAYLSYGTVTNDKTDTLQANTYELTYVSTATLLFYNLTYKGGVTLSASMAQVLTGNKTNKLTVWDEVTDYGDYNTIAGGNPVSLGANGEVVVRITLIGVYNAGYDGTFKFAYAGMENGNGIQTTNKIRTPNASSALLSPIKDGSGRFTRWQEVDLSSYYTSETVDGITYNPTRLFGKISSLSSGTVNTNIVGKHTVNESNTAKYTAENTGTANAGYIVENVQQIKHIETFWKNNYYSCVGITVPSQFVLFDENKNFTPMFQEGSGLLTSNYATNYGKTVFKLTSSTYNLQKLTSTSPSYDPTGSTTAWKPICDVDGEWEEYTKYVYGTTIQPNMSYGFDGILEGGSHTVQGMAVGAFYGECYGLFARISGGEVRNLTFDNAYVQVSSDYVGLIAGKSQYATYTNITIKRVSKLALYSGGLLSSTVSSGTRITMIAESSQGVGLVSGYMESCSVQNVTITAGDGAYAIDIQGNDGNGSAGLLTGILCGNSSVSAVTVQGGNTAAWIKMYAGYTGAIVGTMRDYADMGGVELKVNTNLMLGNEATTAVGGLVGYISSVNAQLHEVAFAATSTTGTGTADDFRYNLTSSSIQGKGVFLFAKNTGSLTTSGLAGSTSGKAGGLVGHNKGYVYNSYGGGSITGVVKAYAGVIGGLVGLNSGRVSGFSLQTGFDSTYKGLITLAWIRHKGTSDYIAGGVVGANIIETANARQENGEWTSYGVVDDVSVTGSTASGTADDAWKHGHLYVFMRTTGDYDEATEYNYMSIPLGHVANQSYGWTYKHSLSVGGIVGYNKGSVFNSFVVNSKVTYKVEESATNQDTGRGRYAWLVRGGLIAGWHNPDKVGSGDDKTWLHSWYELLTSDLSQTNTYLSANDTVSGKIQSCYVKNSAIVVAGRVYMDNGTFWTGSNPVSEEQSSESKPYGVALGGIAGATNIYCTSGYGITACLSQNNKLSYNVTPSGSNEGSDSQSNVSNGWYRRHEQKKSGLFGSNTQDFYYTTCRRVYNVVELRLMSLAPGLYDDNHKGDEALSDDVMVFKSSGDSIYVVKQAGGEASNTSIDYGEYTSFYRHSDSSSGWWSGTSGGYPEQDHYRVNRYSSPSDSIQLDSYTHGLTPFESEKSIDGMNGNVSSFSGSGNKIIATDVKSGLLKWSYSYGNMVLVGDYVASYGEKAAQFNVGNQVWTAYTDAREGVGQTGLFVRGQ